MANNHSYIRRALGAIWKFLSVSRNIVSNLIFLIIIIVIVSSIFAQDHRKIPQNAALVINPTGVIVEQETHVDPMEEFLSNVLDEDPKAETLLKDIIDAIKLAANDARIKLIVLDLSEMKGASLSKLQDIATALDQYKQSGKHVIAVADYYTQSQYYLASFAHEILLNPLGGVALEGFSRYRTYFKSALDKLRIRFHVFRVGNYKSALEPFMRDNMSEPARQANLAWLSALWQQFTAQVSAQRMLSQQELNDYVNNVDIQLAKANGDTAQLALQAGLVDSLKDRHQVNQYLIERVGQNKESGRFNQIDFKTYLSLNKYSSELENNAIDKVGIIVAKGVIYNGKRKAGEIGGDSLAQLIRQVKKDASIKALVLRIDSGGGSAFACEVIRQALLRLKSSGMPIVVSMGGVAASGGYWIAADAHQIFASASTLTGSIGIFAALPTFEKSFDALGIHSDGVGTTQLAGALTVGQALNPTLEKVIQLSIENGYQRFINIVAEGRNIAPEKVEALAQGRIWSGEKAVENGLVDTLGNLDDAIVAAAELAGLKVYEESHIAKPLSPTEQLLKQLSENVSVYFDFNNKELNHPVLSLYHHLTSQLKELLPHGDPQNMYAQCFECMHKI